jgi:hypothetical protein
LNTWPLARSSDVKPDKSGKAVAEGRIRSTRTEVMEEIDLNNVDKQELRRL